MNQTKFHGQLFEREIDRKITRINIHTTWKPEFHIGIKEGGIHLLTDLEEGLTLNGIDLTISRKKDDWKISLWVVSKLMEKFDLEPNNISVRKECGFDKEYLLEEINRNAEIPPVDDEIEDFDNLEELEEELELGCLEDDNDRLY